MLIQISSWRKILQDYLLQSCRILIHHRSQRPPNFLKVYQCKLIPLSLFCSMLNHNITAAIRARDIHWILSQGCSHFLFTSRMRTGLTIRTPLPDWELMALRHGTHYHRRLTERVSLWRTEISQFRLTKSIFSSRRDRHHRHRSLGKVGTRYFPDFWGKPDSRELWEVFRRILWLWMKAGRRMTCRLRW